jgi:hypothetical protein
LAERRSRFHDLTTDGHGPDEHGLGGLPSPDDPRDFAIADHPGYAAALAAAYPASWLEPNTPPVSNQTRRTWTAPSRACTFAALYGTHIGVEPYSAGSTLSPRPPPPHCQPVTLPATPGPVRFRSGAGGPPRRRVRASRPDRNALSDARSRRFEPVSDGTPASGVGLPLLHADRHWPEPAAPP